MKTRPSNIPNSRIALLVAWMLAISLNLSAAEVPRNPDGSGAYATGKYRNLFAEIGKSPPEIRRKIDAAFQQLFHGNPTNEAVYYEADTNEQSIIGHRTSRR